MYRVMLFAQPYSQDIWATSLYSFLCLTNSRCIVGIYIFGTNSFFIIFSIMGSWILQYVWYFLIYSPFWTATCILINKGFLNQYLSQIFQKYIKVSSILRKYFIFGYVFTSVHTIYFYQLCSINPPLGRFQEPLKDTKTMSIITDVPVFRSTIFS